MNCRMNCLFSKKEYPRCAQTCRIVYSFKSVEILTECISDDNDTNKCNNSLNLICEVMFKMVFKIGASDEIKK